MRAEIGLIPWLLSQLHESNYLADHIHHLAPSSLKNDSNTESVVFTKYQVREGLALSLLLPNHTLHLIPILLDVRAGTARVHSVTKVHSDTAGLE